MEREREEGGRGKREEGGINRESESEWVKGYKHQK